MLRALKKYSGLFLTLALGLPAFGAALGLGSGGEKSKATFKEPLCFMFGDAIRSPQDPGPTLGNLIRLRFEAENPAQCEFQFSRYCRKELIGKGHRVGKLSGFFEDAEQRAEFKLNPDCSAQKVLSADERQ